MGRQEDAETDDVATELEPFVNYGGWKVVDSGGFRYTKRSEVVLKAYDTFPQIIERYNRSLVDVAERHLVFVKETNARLSTVLPKKLDTKNIERRLAGLEVLYERTVERARKSPMIEIRQLTLWENANFEYPMEDAQAWASRNRNEMTTTIKWNPLVFRTGLFGTNSDKTAIRLQRVGIAELSYLSTFNRGRFSLLPQIRPLVVGNIDLFYDPSMGEEVSYALSERNFEDCVDSLYQAAEFALASKESYFRNYYFDTLYWLFLGDLKQINRRNRLDYFNERWSWIERGLTFYFVDATMNAISDEREDFLHSCYPTKRRFLFVSEGIAERRPRLVDPKHGWDRKRGRFDRSGQEIVDTYWAARVMKAIFQKRGMDVFCKVYLKAKALSGGKVSFASKFPTAFEEVTGERFDALVAKIMDEYASKAEANPDVISWPQ